ILCEKPAAVNAAEFEEMQAVCEEQDVIFMEAFMYHFHPQHERVKAIIASGEIGEVSYMRSAHTFYMKDPEINVRVNYQAGGAGATIWAGTQFKRAKSGLVSSPNTWIGGSCKVVQEV